MNWSHLAEQSVSGIGGRGGGGGTVVVVVGSGGVKWMG